MWPFKKKPKIEYLHREELNFTQVDITERFGDNLSLSIEEWIETFPINKLGENINPGNLPRPNASDEEIYQIASKLSEITESFNRVKDGVYCPICHIANINRDNLRTPCPRCGRPLLSFDWT